jgi:glycosyltransferase involved in cell wall biosynthesis
MTARISVAMATYNGEKYLRDQLNSLAKQSRPPYEVVVCDDGSTDMTTQILREFAATAPFSVNIYINDSNLGFADNFLKAAGLCQGDWIAFCDQDDVWMPNKLARVEETIGRYPGDELVLIGHTSLIANERLELDGRRLPDNCRDSYVRCASQFGFYCIAGFSMIFRAILVKEFNAALRPRVYQPQALMPRGHDEWISMLANAIGDMANISEPLAIWRRHDDSLSRAPNRRSLLDQAQVSKGALNPRPYILLGKMAKEASESLRSMATVASESRYGTRLETASELFLRLSSNGANRGELYSQQGRRMKIAMFAELVRTNAYIGPRFCSLGWRSLAKDAAFAFGIIG